MSRGQMSKVTIFHYEISSEVGILRIENAKSFFTNIQAIPSVIRTLTEWCVICEQPGYYVSIICGVFGRFFPPFEGT